MQAGRELDALVAKQIMGWKPETEFFKLEVGHAGYAPNDEDHHEETGFFKDGIPIYWYPYYSTDIAAAWEVVSAQQFSSWSMKYDGESKLYTVCLELDGNRHFAQSETAPHAICLAALKAKGVKN